MQILISPFGMSSDPEVVGRAANEGTHVARKPVETGGSPDTISA